MAHAPGLDLAPTLAEAKHPPLATEPWPVRVVLILLTLAFLALFLGLPLAAVFAQALASGKGAYFAALRDPNTLSAIRLTLLTAAISVPLNVLFGIAAAWAVAKFDFWGKNILLTLIDLPFAVSPVVAGLIFVLLLGKFSPLGGLLDAHGIKIIFAMPGIILATTFVTFPFVVRELLPVMQAQGVEEEQAALVLGATGWQSFWRVTVPNIKWGLLYGVILCNARAMGEFGAVSVVSGKIVGQTNTLPLQVEAFNDDYNFVGAFAAASLLAMLGLVTLIVKSFVEWRTAHRER
jgi:sulfate transport system permease protein